jgi:hypothetical protein
MRRGRPPDKGDGRPSQPPIDESDTTHGNQNSRSSRVTDQPPTLVDISRGTAGDCCVLCGRVGVDLPIEHGCVPNLSAEQLAQLEADRRRPRRSLAEILDGAS